MLWRSWGWQSVAKYVLRRVWGSHSVAKYVLRRSWGSQSVAKYVLQCSWGSPSVQNVARYVLQRSWGSQSVAKYVLWRSWGSQNVAKDEVWHSWGSIFWTGRLANLCQPKRPARSPIVRFATRNLQGENSDVRLRDAQQLPGGVWSWLGAAELPRGCIFH